MRQSIQRPRLATKQRFCPSTFDLRIAIPVWALHSRIADPLRDGERGGVDAADDAEAEQGVIGYLLPVGAGDGFDVEEWLETIGRSAIITAVGV